MWDTQDPLGPSGRRTETLGMGNTPGVLRNPKIQGHCGHQQQTRHRGGLRGQGTQISQTPPQGEQHQDSDQALPGGSCTSQQGQIPKSKHLDFVRTGFAPSETPRQG